jgi:hypothetical protein
MVVPDFTLPGGWKPPKQKMKRIIDPKCPKCDGDGGYDVPSDNPRYQGMKDNLGRPLASQWQICECVRYEPID